MQENIEQSLSELQQKPRGLLAKYAKLSQFEDEILGPNKDLTNIDTELKEAEDFLSEEQIGIIRSIVIESEKLIGNVSEKLEGVACGSGCGSGGDDEASKWNNLRPTLKSLGLVREKLGCLVEEDAESDVEDDDLDEDDSKLQYLIDFSKNF